MTRGQQAIWAAAFMNGKGTIEDAAHAVILARRLYQYHEDGILEADPEHVAMLREMVQDEGGGE